MHSIQQLSIKGNISTFIHVDSNLDWKFKTMRAFIL